MTNPKPEYKVADGNIRVILDDLELEVTTPEEATQAINRLLIEAKIEETRLWGAAYRDTTGKYWTLEVFLGGEFFKDRIEALNKK